MASSEKFVKRAHERGQLTLEDVGISVELERDPDWSINGRYSGSDMKRAFEAGRTLKPEEDPTEILEDLIEDIKREQAFRKAKRKPAKAKTL